MNSRAQLRGAGDPPNCTNLPPRGTLDSSSCEALAGWAQDWNHKDQASDVYLSFGAPVFSGAPGRFVKASRHRADLCGPLESCTHAFSVPPPLGLFDGGPHRVHGYALDTEGGRGVELGSSPGTLQCGATPPAGALRHVTYEAWVAFGFDAFQDVQPVSDAVVEARAHRTAFDGVPRLVRAVGTPEVYLVDRGRRRHVTAAAVPNWRFDLAAVEEVSLEARAALREGPPLRERPWLVKGAGPAVFLVDDELPVEVAGTSLSLEPPPLVQGTADAPGADAELSSGGLEVVHGGCGASGEFVALAAAALLFVRRPRR